MAEEHLWAVIVASALEDCGVFGKCPRIRWVDAPPGQNAGQGDDVLLRVPAIGAQRVQFHDLAREVLIEPLPIAAGAGTARGSAERIVEINQHRWVLCGGEQQVAETAQREGTDRLLLVIA